MYLDISHQSTIDVLKRALKAIDFDLSKNSAILDIL